MITHRILFLFLAIGFAACTTDPDDSPEDGGDPNNVIPAPSGDNYAKFGNDSLPVTVICGEIGFGRPRSSLTGRDSTNTATAGMPRVTVEITGTPPDEATYPVVASLVGNSAIVTVYYDAVNYTSSDAGTVTYSETDDVRQVTGSSILVVGDQNSSQTMTISLSLSCSL